MAVLLRQHLQLAQPLGLTVTPMAVPSPARTFSSSVLPVSFCPIGGLNAESWAASSSSDMQPATALKSVSSIAAQAGSGSWPAAPPIPKLHSATAQTAKSAPWRAAAALLISPPALPVAGIEPPLRARSH
jgi:hypothetical protein